MKQVTVTLTESEAEAVGFAIMRAKRDAYSIDLKTRLEAAYRALDAAPVVEIARSPQPMGNLYGIASTHQTIRNLYGGCP